MHVAVNEHGPRVVVSGDAPVGARQRQLDCSFGTRTVELLPLRRNELDEPSSLCGSSR